ncbi:SGNH/GDSL hydrolase family protein [Priestia megaterium]|uniref:SGNH/GDSL hydrolase family protein n=1 Tax=Priestia megaterium TaxID=1404 RepID=UPI003459B7DF
MQSKSVKIYILIVLFFVFIGVMYLGNAHYKGMVKANQQEALKFDKAQVNTDEQEEPNTTTRFKGKTWNAIGDSITERDGYEPIVKKSLELKEYRNYGKSGYTTEMLAKEVGTWEDKADLVTFFAGTNDFGRSVPLSVTRSSARYIFDRIKTKYPDAVVVVLLPTQRWGYTGDITPEKSMKNNKGITLSQYSKVIESEGKSHGFKIVNLYKDSGITKDNITEYTVDGLHPNEAGNQAISSTLIKALSE